MDSITVLEIVSIRKARSPAVTRAPEALSLSRNTINNGGNLRILSKRIVRAILSPSCKSSTGNREIKSTPSPL